MPWMETSPMEQRERFIHDSPRWLCTRWSSSAPATASAARPATSGSGASTAAGRQGLQRAEPRPASVPAPDRRREWRGLDLRRAPAASELGARQAAGLAPAAASGPGPARQQHGRRSPGPRAGSSRSGGAVAATTIPASCRRPPRSPTTSGPPTSRATSAPATASTAIR